MQATLEHGRRPVSPRLVVVAAVIVFFDNNNLGFSIGTTGLL